MPTQEQQTSTLAPKAQASGQPMTEKEETLFSWKASARPFKSRGREFFTTVLSIAALLGIIVFFVEGIMPVFVIVAVVFLIFVLFTVSPDEIENVITNKNIVVGGRKYPIDEVSRFWISERLGHSLLILETPIRFPGRLELVLSNVDKDLVKDTLSRYITLEEASPTFLDRAASWFSKHLPIEP